jgi:uncharacterized Zn finger protein
MQDLSTGQLISLTPQQADEEMKRRAKLEDFIKGIARANEFQQPLPPVADRGPIFAVGEIVEVKGARFRITKIAKGKLILRGLPRQT